MSKTPAERQREYRKRLKARQASDTVTDDSPVLEQAGDVASRSMRKARVVVRRRVTDIDAVNTASLVTKRAIEIEEKRGALVDAELVRECWQAAMAGAGVQLVNLIETLPEELIREAAAGEAAVKVLLDRQIRGALEELQRAPQTWPPELRWPPQA